MTLELGVYSFGNTPRVGDGYGATAQAIRDALEAVKLAEEVGLDCFGFGEHHTRSMPLSSPTAMVNAAARALELPLGVVVRARARTRRARTRSASRGLAGRAACLPCCPAHFPAFNVFSALTTARLASDFLAGEGGL